MQKGKVLSLRHFGIAEFLQKNSFLLILTGCFFVGVFLGVYLFGDIKSLADLPKDFISQYISLRSDNGFGKILFCSALRFWSFIFLAFLLGASLFGVVTVPALIVAQGFVYGGVTAYLYSVHSIKGIAFNTIVFIPSVIIYIICLLLASREAIRFSLKLSSLTLNKTLPFSLSQNFKDYSIKFSILAVAVFFSSLVDAFISVGILKYFNL